MNVAKSIKCKVTTYRDIFLPTLNIYRDALGFIINVVNNEWQGISILDTAKDKLNYVEKLIHKTKKNKNPKYKKFDEKFYKFPSYFRRSATSEAIGIVSSYRSNLANYNQKKEELAKEGKVLLDKPPCLSNKHYVFPVFYKGNMFKTQREKLHFWAKMKIQNKVKEMANRHGIRYSRVNSKNTSKLAFDGSGEVKRNNRKDLCTFTTGKVYHSDLNASYNIGARYFIREYIKTTSEKKWSEAVAKVPELQTRTKCTLASLISLVKAI